MESKRNDAIKQIEREFGIKKKKKVSDSMIMKNWRVKNIEFNTSDTDYTIRLALLSAATSPYLRAMVVLYENEESTNATFIEMSEHQLSINERVGALMPDVRSMLQLKEMGYTHTMNVDGLSKILFELLKEEKATNVQVINIHHDYIRSFCEVPIRKEELIFHLLYNDHEPNTTVIRTVKEDRGLSQAGNTNCSEE